MDVNQTNMRTFVAALRSGEFKQATGALRKFVLDADGLATDEIAGYCCLGVATEMALRDGVVYKSACEDSSCDQAKSNHTVWGEKAFLSEEVQAWLGIVAANPSLGVWPLRQSASGWNDQGLTGFSQIANLFEDEFLPEDAAAREAALPVAV